MKLYLVITCALFGLLALAHILRTIAEWPRLTTQPSFVLEGPGIALVAAALSIWAWRLLRLQRRPA
jgi:hypothetical protein